MTAPGGGLQREIQLLVDKSLNKARKYRAAGNFGHAYAHYTAVIELAPRKRAEVNEEFTDVLCKWGMDLERSNFEKTVLCYNRSLHIFPENPRMLNNFAAHYLRQDSPREALPYLMRALAASPDFLPAEWNLDYAYNLLIDRWHYPMLNDRVRNTAYERAIISRIAQGYNTVLDIGTGSGLLSLYSKHSGAIETYACETSTEMAFIADRVFSKNSSEDIQLLPMHSTAIQIPRDMPHRVKLIVTETFDAGVFGELALSTLIHAHEHLLEKNGMILPMRAKILAAAVESPQIRFMSFVTSFQNSTDVTLDFSDVDIYSDNKNYDAITLKSETRVTDPVEILNVDFNNLRELKSLHSEGVKNVSSTICKTDGIIDGVVTWFQLQLDEDTMIDTSEEDSCWQLAVFSDKPAACSVGQRLTIITELFEEKLHCVYEFRRRDNTTWRKCKWYFFVPKHVIMFLNDVEYIGAIARAAQVHKNGRFRFILDACPFPIYGLEMLKHNEEVLKVFCYAETEQLKEMIFKIADINGLDTTRICIIESLEEVDRSLDVIFNHNFSIQGEINDWGEPSLYEGLRLSLSGDGFMLPRKIFLIGQLVHSDDLPKMVLVDDRNLQRSSGSTYVIGEFINHYACKQRFDLDSTLYKCVEISEERVLVQIDEGNDTKAVANFGRIPKNGVPPNVLLCWYTIHLDGDNCVKSKRDNSFMNHSAIVLPKEINEVIENEGDVKFEILQMKGLTRVTLVR